MRSASRASALRKRISEYSRHQGRERSLWDQDRYAPAKTPQRATLGTRTRDGGDGNRGGNGATTHGDDSPALRVCIVEYVAHEKTMPSCPRAAQSLRALFFERCDSVAAEIRGVVDAAPSV